MLLIQDYCTHDKEFIENLKDIYGDDQYMDEDILEILHEYLDKKEIQTNFHDMQENSQQLVMSSLTEVDISQNSDSTSYLYFPETDDSLQHSCLSLCDQERIWDCKSNYSSYYSSPECL